MRRRWGCDEEARAADGQPRAVFTTTCPRCNGTRADPTGAALGEPRACGRCGGRGEVDYSRCPSSMVSGGCRDLLRMVRAYQAHGLLPFDGPLTEQPRRFWDALEAFVAERARIERELRDARR